MKRETMANIYSKHNGNKKKTGSKIPFTPHVECRKESNNILLNSSLKTLFN